MPNFSFSSSCLFLFFGAHTHFPQFLFVVLTVQAYVEIGVYIYISLKKKEAKKTKQTIYIYEEKRSQEDKTNKQIEIKQLIFLIFVKKSFYTCLVSIGNNSQFIGRAAVPSCKLPPSAVLSANRFHRYPRTVEKYLTLDKPVCIVLPDNTRRANVKLHPDTEQANYGLE